MTINGVKKALNSDNSNIDEIYNTSIKQKEIFKSKVSKIKNIIKNLKNNNG